MGSSWILTNYGYGIIPGAARGLLGSRHLVVKIADFTDFHPILRGFQRYLGKLGRYFLPKRPQESELPLVNPNHVDILRCLTL